MIQTKAKKQTALWRTVSVIMCILVSFALIFTAFTLPVSFARATEEEFGEFDPISLSLTNTDFTNSSGNAPSTPTDWTGGYAANMSGNGNVVSGVIDLTPSEYESADNNEAFKLSSYPEYAAAAPQTPFGTAAHGYDKKTLLINIANGANSAYGYTSAEMTLAQSAYFRFSVWVKTGDFATGTGASIRINGLDTPIAINNINTVKGLSRDSNNVPVLNSDNLYGWKQYFIYVATSPLAESTVTLTLMVGDDPTDDEQNPKNTASGYAFFDAVTAERISPSTFAHESNNVTYDNDSQSGVSADGTLKLFNISKAKYLTNENGDDIGTFSNRVNPQTAKPLGWTNAEYKNDDNSYGDGSDYFLYNTETVFHETNSYGLTAPPRSPLGSAEDRDNPMFTGTDTNILVITSYANGRYQQTAKGIKSEDFTVERFKAYRVSVWVKGDSVTEGNGISVALCGDTYDSTKTDGLDTWYNSIDVSSGTDENFGWTEHVMFVKGSSFGDAKIHMELWLGTPESKSRGVAMFDNVTIQEISLSDYSVYSANSNAVTLDPTETDTGVTNGNFLSVADYDEYKFPMAPADWTQFTPDTLESTKYSHKAVDSTEDAVCGIIPTDSAHFDAQVAANPNVYAGAANPRYFDGAESAYNVMLLASKKPTAIGYRSATMTVATDSEYTVTVNMAVNNISGYGATLVLRNADNEVLSTIEGITDTNNAFKDYKFYIDAPLSEQTVCVEVWLGFVDRTDNSQKLSSGAVYVNSVSFATSTDDNADDGVSVYDNMLSSYKNAVSQNEQVKLSYAVYSFTDYDLVHYDRFSNDFIKTSYNYNYSPSVADYSVGGVFNSDAMIANSEIPASFNKKDQSGAILYLRNKTESYSTIAYNHSLTLAASTYYRLDVAIKVDIAAYGDKAIGAGIHLTGTKTYDFEDIKDTAYYPMESNPDSKDNEAFKVYSIYIATGADGGNIGLHFSLGGNDNSKQHIAGRLYVGSVTLNSITNLDYDNFTSEYDKAIEEDEDDPDYQNVAYVELSGEAEEEPPEEGETETTGGGLEWYILPTVIFGACLIAALIIVMVVKIKDKRKSKKSVVVKNEYDRTNVSYTKADKKAAKDSASKKGKSTDVVETADETEVKETPNPMPDIAEEFDDNTVKTSKKAKKAKTDGKATDASDAETSTESSSGDTTDSPTDTSTATETSDNDKSTPTETSPEPTNKSDVKPEKSDIEEFDD